MKILVSAVSFSSCVSGVQRHAFNMVHCLLPRPEISALHIAVAPWQASLLPEVGLIPDGKLFTHVAKTKRSSVSRNLWHYRQLPELAATIEADVVHLTIPVPVRASAFTCPTVVTLHDLYPYEIPQNFGFPKFVFNRAVLRQCLCNVTAIACVSDTTRRALHQRMPSGVGQKAVRIYNCVEPARLSAIESPIPNWQGQPFLLSVAQHRRNKNIPVLIRAFDRILRRGRANPALMLVVVGMQGPETPHIQKLVSSLGLRERIHLLEGLSDAELQWCYERCAAVVAPSITEGFGLPVAEALLTGGRIVCSDIPAFREVGGAYCRYVTLQQDAESSLADAIAVALRQPKQPPVPLPQFAGSAQAQEYVSLYRRLITDYAIGRNVKRTSSVHAAVPGGPSL